MNKQYIGTAILAVIFCTTIYSCAVRRSEPITGATVNVSDPRVKNGQVLYHKYCQKCHPAGEAGLGPNVISKPGFAKRFQIKHGVGTMPAFKERLPKEDIKDIALYLKKLNRVKKDAA